MQTVSTSQESHCAELSEATVKRAFFFLSAIAQDSPVVEDISYVLAAGIAKLAGKNKSIQSKLFDPSGKASCMTRLAQSFGGKRVSLAITASFKSKSS